MPNHNDRPETGTKVTSQSTMKPRRKRRDIKKKPGANKKAKDPYLAHDDLVEAIRQGDLETLAHGLNVPHARQDASLAGLFRLAAKEGQVEAIHQLKEYVLSHPYQEKNLFQKILKPSQRPEDRLAKLIHQPDADGYPPAYYAALNNDASSLAALRLADRQARDIPRYYVKGPMPRTEMVALQRIAKHCPDEITQPLWHLYLTAPGIKLETIQSLLVFGHCDPNQPYQLPVAPAGKAARPDDDMTGTGMRFDMKSYMERFDLPRHQKLQDLLLAKMGSYNAINRD